MIDWRNPAPAREVHAHVSIPVLRDALERVLDDYVARGILVRADVLDVRLDGHELRASWSGVVPGAVDRIEISGVNEV